MKRILIGVCSNRHDQSFWDSFFPFIHEASRKYSIGSTIVKNTFLPDAQNQIAECFMKCDYDYLLLLDDDHTGHTVAMLDCLINADTYMATIKTYSRHYPYHCTLMRKHGNAYAGIEDESGYRECDMTGFPMTLLKRELFDKLNPPYFKGRNDGGRDWATDRVFCERLSKLDIKPMGCFQFTLPHGSITQENVNERRFQERHENNNIALFNRFKQKQMQPA